MNHFSSLLTTDLKLQAKLDAIFSVVIIRIGSDIVMHSHYQLRIAMDPSGSQRNAYGWLLI